MSQSTLRLKLSALVDQFGGELIGADVEISNVASLDSAECGDLAFYTGAKYSDKVAACKSSALVVKQHFSEYSHSQIVVKDPQLFIARALKLLNPAKVSSGKIHVTAVVADDAEVAITAEIGPFVVIESGAVVGENTIIDANSFIGKDTKIGMNCWLHPRVVVYAGCVIGDNNEIHSGAVVGSDGFGNAWNGKAWEKIPQIGKVIIGSNVEIGANTTIDRGALDDTVISDGVRLDNLIQIGHNVKIGAHTAIAACSGIAGSTTIGANCLIGGGSLISGHIQITNGVTLISGSGTPSSLTEPGVYACGVPTMPYSVWARSGLQYRRLDEIAKRLKKLEKSCQNKELQQSGEENAAD